MYLVVPSFKHTQRLNTVPDYLRWLSYYKAPMSTIGQQGQEQQQGQQIQIQQRRRQRSGRAPKHPSSRTYVQSNRRIYDLRTWHKRKSIDKAGSLDWGQPPAGWVLVWAGRFKRWRRRWFLAHPAGLLLYYKNSDQLGRPGCISLQVKFPSFVSFR